MTKKQRKEVRRALRQYDGRSKWAAVLDRVRDYYTRTDPACWELLRMRYLEGMREEDVIRALYIGRTTYYSKELEALSTVGNREELLGPWPAGCKARPRAAADAGSRNLQRKRPLPVAEAGS